MRRIETVPRVLRAWFGLAVLFLGPAWCCGEGSGKKPAKAEETKRFLCAKSEEIAAAQEQLRQLQELVAYFNLPCRDPASVEGRAYALEEFARNSDQPGTDLALAGAVRTFSLGRPAAMPAETPSPPREGDGRPPSRVSGPSPAPLMEYSQLNPAPLTKDFRRAREGGGDKPSPQPKVPASLAEEDPALVLFRREITTFLVMASREGRLEHILLAVAIWRHCLPQDPGLRESLSQVWQQWMDAPTGDADRRFERIRTRTGVGSVGRTPLADQARALGARWREWLDAASPSALQLETMARDELEKMREEETEILRLIEANRIRQALESLQALYQKSRGLIRTRAFSLSYRIRLREFLQKTEALEVARKAGRTEEARDLLRQIQRMAADFDSERPLAEMGEREDRIRGCLEEAKKALQEWDEKKFRSEIRKAAELAPDNAEVARRIADLERRMEEQRKRLKELDELIRVWDVKKIYEWQREKFRLPDPVQQAKVGEALREYQEREANLEMVKKIARKPGMAALAWDEAEKHLRQNRNQPDLAEFQKKLEAEAGAYVRAVRQAEAREKEGDWGAAFFFFLQAREEWQGSEIAQQGLSRLAATLEGPR